MGRIKRGGYIFEFWVGDHFPEHVHVFKDSKIIAKIYLEDLTVMEGKINKKIINILKEIKRKGIL